MQISASNAGSNRPLSSLKQICLRAVGQHMGALDMKALELPASVLKDLLPHLTVTHLDRLQPGLNLKGISTFSAWLRIWHDIIGLNHNVGDFTTEEDIKQKVMETLLQAAIYGLSSAAKYISNDATDPLLLAKHTKHFSLRPSQFLQSLTREQSLTPVLRALERSVSRVDLKMLLATSSPATQCHTLYALHRLLDHGVARELVVSDQAPGFLPWLFRARGAPSGPRGGEARCVSEEEEGGGAEEAGDEEDEEDGGIPCKRAKFHCVSEGRLKCLGRSTPEDLCGAFAPGPSEEEPCGALAPGPSRESCPRGQIESLQLWKCCQSDLSELVPFLPTWTCLRSLTLESHSIDNFDAGEVTLLADALRQLCAAPGNALADLSVGVLRHARPLALLLDACPALRSLAVELEPEPRTVDPADAAQPGRSSPELPLERLSVTLLPQTLMDSFDSITSALQRCPNLTSLHLSRIKTPTMFPGRALLNVISESNRRLRTLCLEDLNLATCSSEILHLLSSCVLEELSLQDCRLLERCGEDFLQQLVASLRNVPSLRSLNLSHNRLAKKVPVLAELFAGALPSGVTRLDISSNRVRPEGLLALARRLEEHRPPQPLTLDLRRNPWDLDQRTWDTALTALRALRPACHPLTDRWRARVMMADYVGNM